MKSIDDVGATNALEVSKLFLLLERYATNFEITTQDQLNDFSFFVDACAEKKISLEKLTHSPLG